MSEIDLKNEFGFLSIPKRQKDFLIKENKIQYYYDSLIISLLYLPFLGSFIYYYYTLAQNQPKIYDMSNLVIWSPWYFVFYAIFYYVFQASIILDFEKNCIYYRAFLLNYRKITLDDILLMCNNCIVGRDYSKISRNGRINGKKIKVNPRTNKYQIYYSSILLKDGEFIDLIKFGMFMDDYQDSVYFTKKLSCLWNIPLRICSDYETFLAFREKDGHILKKLEIESE